MLWIGVQFCVCLFLDSRDKFLNMFNFWRNDQRNERTKEEQRERPCHGIRLQGTKCTVWPRNESSRELIEISSKTIRFSSNFFQVCQGELFCSLFKLIFPVKINALQAVV